MKCKKCLKDFKENLWKIKKTYEGIDYHHNPPKFMVKNWVGEEIILCRSCHRKLHDLIIKILNEEARTLKFCKSEHWVLTKLSLVQREKATERIIKFTNEWLKNDNC